MAATTSSSETSRSRANRLVLLRLDGLEVLADDGGEQLGIGIVLALALVV